MRLAFWIAAVPALLLSTASVQAAGAFAAGLSLGGSVIKLPTGQNGILTSGDVTIGGDSEPLIYAPHIGFNAAASLGKWGEYDAFAGVNLFATFGSAGGSMTQTFSGLGTVYIPGISLPDAGSINIQTTRGASTSVADWTVTDGLDTHDYNSVTGPADGRQSDAYLSATDPTTGFIVSGVNNDVTGGVATTLAYGGIANETGSLLIITGDLEGLSISTNTTTTVLYAGGDMTVGVSKALDEDLAAQAYVGPSYRYVGQWSTTNTGASLTVDIPEVDGSTTVHPYWDQTTTVTTALNSHYFGGVVGGGISKRVSDQISVGLAGEASMYYASAFMSGQGSVTTRDGVDTNVGNSPTITIAQDPVSVNAGTIAFAARAQASATYNIAETTGITIAGSVDYLSAVARPYGGAAVTGTGGNASWSAGDSANSLISFGDMFVFTGTVSLTGQF